MTTSLTTATAFARGLESAFSVESSSVPFGEVALLRALMRSFSALKPRFRVDEFHGSKHQVYFDTSKPWLRKRARCELCDLLVIAYSVEQGVSARMTLLQTKLSHTRHDGLGLAGPKGVDHVNFQANYEQWDLLAARPTLIPTSVFAPPRDLLSAAAVPSIGSFGVFHRDAAASIGFFYASADCLAPAAVPSGSRGGLQTVTASTRSRSSGGLADITYCGSLAQFGASLYRLEIGTPVVTTSPGGAVAKHQPWANWARGVLAAHVQTGAEPDSPSQELLNYLELRGGNPRAYPRLMPSVLVVKGEKPPMGD